MPKSILDSKVKTKIANAIKTGSSLVNVRTKGKSTRWFFLPANNIVMFVCLVQYLLDNHPNSRFSFYKDIASQAGKANLDLLRPLWDNHKDRFFGFRLKSGFWEPDYQDDPYPDDGGVYEWLFEHREQEVVLVDCSRSWGNPIVDGYIPDAEGIIKPWREH